MLGACTGISCATPRPAASASQTVITQSKLGNARVCIGNHPPRRPNIDSLGIRKSQDHRACALLWGYCFETRSTATSFKPPKSPNLICGTFGACTDSALMRKLQSKSFAFPRSAASLFPPLAALARIASTIAARTLHRDASVAANIPQPQAPAACANSKASALRKCWP
jgi:hypothetical protein